jgi:hypothetical protein
MLEWIRRERWPLLPQITASNLHDIAEMTGKKLVLIPLESMDRLNASSESGRSGRRRRGILNISHNFQLFPNNPKGGGGGAGGAGIGRTFPIWMAGRGSNHEWDCDGHIANAKLVIQSTIFNLNSQKNYHKIASEMIPQGF